MFYRSRGAIIGNCAHEEFRVFVIRGALGMEAAQQVEWCTVDSSVVVVQHGVYERVVVGVLAGQVRMAPRR